MFNPQQFLKNNTYEIKKVCEDAKLFEKVSSEILNIQERFESDAIPIIKNIYKKYNIKVNRMITESIQISDIDLYEEWLHKSYS